MGTRRQQMVRIVETLEEHGWRRDSVEKACDWWADEIWSLRSERNPIGARAWMAFLVDPEWTGPRTAGEGVFAVAADVVRRKEPTGWLVQIPLGRRWERGLEELLAALQAARAANPGNAQESKSRRGPTPKDPGRVKTKYRHLR